MRPEADLGAFLEAESRNAEGYRNGCRTFGWECLGNYACAGLPASRPFTHVHVYVIQGSDPAEAMRAAQEASAPPGFAEIVAVGQSFMTSQDDTAVAWLHASHGQPSRRTPLQERSIIVALLADGGRSEHAGHTGWLGRFEAEGIEDAKQAEVCVHDCSDLDPRPARGWLLTPVAAAAEAVPALQ